MVFLETARLLGIEQALRSEAGLYPELQSQEAVLQSIRVS